MRQKATYQGAPAFHSSVFVLPLTTAPELSADVITRTWLDKTPPVPALGHEFEFICMPVAVSEHVLDPGASMLPWNLFSLAVRHQHLNPFPFEGESPCALQASLYKAWDSTLLLHNYPTGRHTGGLSCVRYMGEDQEQAFSSFGLGRDFSKRKSEPLLGVVKWWPSLLGCSSDRMETDVSGCASYWSLPSY